MIRFLFLLLMFSLNIKVAAAETEAATNASDIEQIQSIVNAFNKNMKEKSVDGFLSLFQSDDAPFVMPVRTLPDSMTISSENGVYSKTALSFIEGVAKLDGIPEESFIEPDIQIFEHLAVLTSRYEFTLNGTPINDGTEIWSLIRTDDGWKIVSVMWTQHMRNEN